MIGLFGLFEPTKGTITNLNGETIGIVLSRHRSSTRQLSLRVRINGLDYHATARRRKNGGASVIALRRAKPSNGG